MDVCLNAAALPGTLASIPGAAAVSWILAHPLETLETVFGLGFVIFVHELGHFLVAKACGVKCEKFFLGFDVGGLKLLSFRWGETEYGIGAVPLGGYVKMLGQDDNPAAAAAEAERARAAGESSAAGGPAWDPRSYPAQSVPKRMAIISAGVIMNVIFAVLMAAWAYGIGVRELTCEISGVRPGGAAWRAGLRTGDEITAIAGNRDPVFTDLRHGVTVGSTTTGVEFTVRRPADGSTRTVVLRPDLDLGAPTIGVSSPLSLTLPADLGKGLPGAAGAARPPLAAGDRITAVAGLPVATYAELVAALAPRADRPVTLTIARPPRDAAGAGTTLEVELPPEPARTVGLAMTARAVSAVQDDSPAAAAGIRPGDRLVTIDGEPAGDPLTIDARLRARAGDRVRLGLARAGEPDREVEVVPRPVTWSDDGSNWPLTPASIPSLGLALPIDALVAAVDPDGPAARAGIVPGDRIIRVRFAADRPGEDRGADTGLELSESAPNWPVVAAAIRDLPPEVRVVCTVAGAAGSREVELVPQASAAFVADRGLVFEPVTRTVRAASLPAALGKGARKTRQDLGLVWGFLGKLSRGEISPRLMGGPIAIAQQAGKSAQEGLGALLLFLTTLSANLAVMNFLPIPVLDGGHMVFLAYELVRGKPPSERVVAVLTMLGLGLLLTLMIFVFGLDLRLIPRR